MASLAPVPHGHSVPLVPISQGYSGPYCSLPVLETVYQKSGTVLKTTNYAVFALVGIITIHRRLTGQPVHPDEFGLDSLIHGFKGEVIRRVQNGSLTGMKAHVVLACSVILDVARLFDIIYRIRATGSAHSFVPGVLDYTDSFLHGALNPFGTAAFWISWANRKVIKLSVSN